MLKYKSLIIVLGCLLYFQGQAASVDTIVTRSASMKKDIKAVVILPDNYTKNTSYPVVYLLHGAGGNYADWVKNVPEIKEDVDIYQFIIVCADGNVTSWYFDSPIDPTWKYETYVSTELVNSIDKKYNTIKNRSGRAITGLSMGGHGALSLAFKHQDVYSAAGSLSGGVDLCPFPNNWNISKRLGIYAENQERWKNNSVVNMIYMLTPNSLDIAIDCGVDDFFYPANVKLHDLLTYNNIPHNFSSRPGAHTWTYWRNSIHYQLLYFKRSFSKNSVPN
jgi:S-formylglutathione hydrolase FrmB